ncbi:MAG: TIGR03545 family protein [Epsilonproteobacteria bacterium]|nr:TIGR03545 family protein [Campylobacterota bacterium]
MEFFIKLLRELNSAKSEKFITLALILGLISAFLPFFNIFNLLILAAVLIIRIPLGLFMASWGFFSIIAAALDPVFAKIGYATLTSGALTPLWEALYNLPLIRWSGYNNTVVMGGLVSGLILGAIAWFILNPLIKIYRQSVYEKLKNIPALSWMFPKDDKNSLIRLSGVGVLLTFTAAVVLFFVFAFDSVLKTALEKSLSYTIRKPVTIKSLKTSFNKENLSLYIYGLSVDKYRAKAIKADIDTYYLLWRKFDFKNITFNGLKSDQNIQELLKTSSNKKSVPPLIPSFDIPKADVILKKEHFKSPQKLKQLQKDYQEFNTILAQLKKDINKDDINQIKSEFKKIQQASKHIKTPQDINNILTLTQNLNNKIKALQEKYKKDKKLITDYSTKIQKDIKELQVALKEDYQTIDKRYSLLKSGDYLAFAQTFFKPEINKYINTALAYYEKIKPYLQKDNTQQLNRAEGMFIKYKDKIRFPDLFVNTLQGDIEFKNAAFNLLANNLTDNQKILNLPIKANVDSTSKFYNSLNLKLYYLKKLSSSLNIKALKVKNTKLDKLLIKDYLLNVVSNGVFVDENFNIKALLLFNNATLVFKDNSKYGKIIAQILKDIKNFKLKFNAKGNIRHYSLSVSSDLDKIISKLLKKRLTKELEKQKLRAKKLLKQQINSQLSRLKIDKELINKLNSQELTLSNIQKELLNYSKKNLQNQIKQKATKKIEDELQKRLNKLF